LELLAELRAEAVPCVMVTMSYRRLAEAVIASCPADSFVGLICGDEVSAGKPDPEPYLKGAGLLGLDPADCVALEDSKPGLASAEAAGTIAVGVPHFVDLEPRPGRLLWPSLEGRGVADLRRLRAQQSAQTPSHALGSVPAVGSGSDDPRDPGSRGSSVSPGRTQRFEGAPIAQR